MWLIEHALQQRGAMTREPHTFVEKGACVHYLSACSLVASKYEFFLDFEFVMSAQPYTGDTVAETLAKYSITNFTGSPTLYRMLKTAWDQSAPGAFGDIKVASDDLVMNGREGWSASVQWQKPFSVADNEGLVCRRVAQSGGRSLL
jgi:hypothetical protein